MAKKKRKRSTIAIKLATEKAVRDQIRNPSKSASPGVKARAANILRTGQAIPVITKGKPDKRNPLQIVSDRRAKRRATQVRGK